jgi:hypothetical protein
MSLLMRRVSLGLPQLLALLAPVGVTQDLIAGKVLELKLLASDPVLPGQGPSRTFDHDVNSDGTLYVWAASEDCDPVLRVTDAAANSLAEDDDSGGGTTAFLDFEVTANERSPITVAAADP